MIYANIYLYTYKSNQFVNFVCTDRVIFMITVLQSTFHMSIDLPNVYCFKRIPPLKTPTTMHTFAYIDATNQKEQKPVAKSATVYT